MTATAELYRSYLDLRWHFDPAAATAARGAWTRPPARRLLRRSGAGAPGGVQGDRSERPSSWRLKIPQEEIDRTAFLDELRVTIARFERERPHVHDPSFWLGHLYNAFQALLRRREDTPEEKAAGLLGRLNATPVFLKAALETPEGTAADLSGHGPGARGGGPATAGRCGAGRARLAVPWSPRWWMTRSPRRKPHWCDSAWRSATTSGPITMISPSRSVRNSSTSGCITSMRSQASAPELYRYGLHLADEVEAEVAALARQIDPRASWRTVVERLGRSRRRAPTWSVRSGMQWSGPATSSKRARLVTIPEGTLEVRGDARLPATADAVCGVQSARGLWRGAGTGHSTSPRQRRGEPQAKGQYSLHEIAATAVHEAWPGHHLHMLTARNAASDLRRVSWTPVTVEGWALYCEELMAEQGFFASVEERLFQRLHLLWRAVRIVLDVGLHTRGMTPEQAVDLLVDRVAMDRTKARAEVSRYCAWPTYQLCYAVGRREFLHLREAWRENAGGAPLREFHDRVLSYGGLPVSLIRWGMGLGIDE